MQQLPSMNSGDVYLESTPRGTPAGIAVSVVRENRTGDIIFKIVNTRTMAEALSFHSSGKDSLVNPASETGLSARHTAVIGIGGAAAL